MRILQSLFLLILLTFVATSIFLATLDGIYQKQETSIIRNISKTEVFNYVNDSKNWKHIFLCLKQDATAKIKYSEKKSGKGALCLWNGNTDGFIETIDIKENKEILQKKESGDVDAELIWTFRDTLDGTKIILRTKYKLSLIQKVKALFGANANQVLNINKKKNIYNLNLEDIKPKIEIKDTLATKDTLTIKDTLNSKILTNKIKNKATIVPEKPLSKPVSKTVIKPKEKPEVVKELETPQIPDTLNNNQ